MKLSGSITFFALSILLITIIFYVAVYVLISIFLNNFNKLVNGKGTALAWIPICNIYLLGKLTINKIVGWIFVVCIFITGTFTVTINGVANTYTILPGKISSIVSIIYDISVFALLIYSVIKYNNLKHNEV